MIKLKNRSEFVVQLRQAGSAAAANNVDARQLPFACNLVGIEAYAGVVGVNGTGGTNDVIADINKNNTTIFSGAAKVNWDEATPARLGAVGALTTDLLSFAAGDVVSLDVDQIYNGTTPTQPINLTVVLIFSRRQSLPPATVLGGVADDFGLV